jgi:hypothetical protein
VREQFALLPTRNLEIARSGMPVTPTGAWGKTTCEYDEEFMSRLAAFAKSQSTLHNYGAMWNGHSANHAVLMNYLLNDQLRDAHNYLNHFHDTPLMHGITQGDWSANNIRSDQIIAQQICNRIWDVLLGVCEYLAIVPVQNPEQGPVALSVPIDTLAYLLSSNVPGYRPLKWQGGLYGLNTNIGIMGERDLTSLYLAHKIHARFPTADAAIMEIGGGGGYIPYWLHLMGHRNITMVDLPTIIICQAYQLSANLGKEHLLLPNESGTAAIRWLTPDQIATDTAHFDCVVNTDSMPEMAIEHVRNYLDIINSRSKTFFSVNQETETGGQHSVHKLAKEYQMSLTERSLFWLRRGYTEEWYFMLNNWA